MKRSKKIMYLLGDLKEQFYLLFFINFDGISVFLEGLFDFEGSKINYLLVHRIPVVSLVWDVVQRVISRIIQHHVSLNE